MQVQALTARICRGGNYKWMGRGEAAESKQQRGCGMLYRMQSAFPPSRSLPASLDVN